MLAAIPKSAETLSKSHMEKLQPVLEEEYPHIVIITIVVYTLDLP
jgi:hypothetical protein